MGDLTRLQQSQPIQITDDSANTVTVTASSALKVDGSAVTQPINIAQVNGSTVSTAATGVIKVGISDSSGTSITLGQTTMSASVPVVIASNQSTVNTTKPNLQVTPTLLFDATTNQAGVSQQGALFPATVSITGGLPSVGSGSVATLTNSGNVCGAVFSPATTWDSVFLDIAGVGATSGKTITLEIGRLAASGAMAQALASVVLTTSTTTISSTTTNIFTGVTGHSSVTWRLFDNCVFTLYNSLGFVLQSTGGTTGGGPAQLALVCHDLAYCYVIVTSLDATFTEVMMAMEPSS